MHDLDRSNEVELPERAPSLFNALRVLRERWWIVALAAIACMGAAVAIALRQTKEYEATSSLVFRNSQLSQALFGSEVFSPSTDPTRDASTNVELVTSLPVARAVRRSLRLQRSPQALIDQTSAQPAQNSDIVDVTVTDPDPPLAARIANAFTSRFVIYRRDSDRQRIQEGEQLIRRRLVSLPPTASERNQLDAALQKLIALEAVQTGNAEVVDQAQVPSSPASPKPKLNAVLGLLVGALLGVGIAFLLDLLDRRVKSVEEFERLYRRRAIVAVPQRTFAALESEDRSAALEPFRILRASIDFHARIAPSRTLIVTSAIPGTGKTTVAVNLARASALAGQRTVIVECDLRRPSIQRHLDVRRDDAGLSNVLIGSARIDDVLVEQREQVATLNVLPAGPLPPNPAELLRSRPMQAALAELAEDFDLVVLDAPPLLPVADARILLNLPQVNACVHVVRAYEETRGQARRAHAVFEQLQLQPLGLVVTGLRESQSEYSYEYATDTRAILTPEPAEVREPATPRPRRRPQRAAVPGDER